MTFYRTFKFGIVIGNKRVYIKRHLVSNALTANLDLKVNHFRIIVNDDFHMKMVNVD